MTASAARAGRTTAGTGSRRAVRLLLASLVLLVVTFMLVLRAAYQVGTPGDEVSLDEVYRLADQRQVVSTRLLDQDAQVVGVRCVPPSSGSTGVPPGATAAPEVAFGAPVTCSGPTAQFHVPYPGSDVATQQLIDRLALGGARVVIDQQGAKAIGKLVVSFVLPLLVLANLFALIFVSRGDGGVGAIAGFGQLARSRTGKGRSGGGVTFSDVAGAEEAVTELREVIDYLGNPKKFEAYGAAPPKGVLLFGPPGCGKTLLARAVAGETGVPFFSISGAEFIESLVGVGAARVRDLFRQVRAVAPAIVFIDEIDAVGRRRGSDAGSGGEREQTVNQLLVEMDGFEVTAGIVVMAATNRGDILDTALLRPGRFDRHVTLDPPDVKGREAILALHARNRPMSPDVDYQTLARRTPGFTGADLANVINEGALLAIRQGKKGARIDNEHLAEAVQRVLHGPQRRGRLMTAEERKRIAFHESGHAVVAAALGRLGSVQRVSVVARGRGLGQSMMGDEAERVLLTASEVEASLAVAMAGLAAEVLAFGEPSTAAEHDIDRATVLAREMVGRYGMSAELGRLRILNGHNGDSDGAAAGWYSGDTLQRFDAEVKRLLDGAEQTATDVLARHLDGLESMVEALEEAETLEGPRLEQLLAGVRPEMNLFAGPRGNGGRARGRRRAPTPR